MRLRRVKTWAIEKGVRFLIISMVESGQLNTSIGLFKISLFTRSKIGRSTSLQDYSTSKTGVRLPTCCRLFLLIPQVISSDVSKLHYWRLFFASSPSICFSGLITTNFRYSPILSNINSMTIHWLVRIQWSSLLKSRRISMTTIWRWKQLTYG